MPTLTLLRVRRRPTLPGSSARAAAARAAIRCHEEVSRVCLVLDSVDPDGAGRIDSGDGSETTIRRLTWFRRMAASDAGGLQMLTRHGVMADIDYLEMLVLRRLGQRARI